MAGPRDGGGELATLVQNAASRKPHLLFFYSRACGLCKRLAPDVGKIEGSALPVSRICADNDKRWAPEMLQYSVDKVPCFVLLDQQGRGVARSGDPVGYERMSVTLEAMQRIAQTLK